MNVALELRPRALLRSLAPVSQWLADDQVRLVRQQVDAEWIYAKRTPRTQLGFNPLRAEVHIADNGLVARWLDGEDTPLCVLNENDCFMRELLFCVHDYLHAWATQQIVALLPELGFATGRLDAQNLDVHTFALLVTEAVAVVGVDYWWLSTVDLPAQLGIGSCVENLAVSYRERDLPEFRRANPDFCAQTPAFFRAIAEFYCHGRFPGFDLEDVRRSPRLLRWLQHELSYGAVQRRYARCWLSHLAGLPLPNKDAAEAPIACEADWQSRLLDEIGARLWAKIKAGDPCLAPVELDPEMTWRAPERGPIDARFTNLASYEDPDAVVEARGMIPDSRAHWAEQRLRLHADPGPGGAGADPALLEVLPSLVGSVAKDEGKLLRWALRERPRFTSTNAGVARDLFFLK